MSDNRTIAKNTMFLYFRMFLTMGVGLYTSRLVLEALGVVDYGIYGLVGGIVTMFSFLSSSMAAATQRFLLFDIGAGDANRLRKTFSASVNIHFVIAFIVVLLAETIGLWFINHKLTIPSDRLYAANWVYQFSIFTFFFSVIQVPYNALLIARERMGIYAYISIGEVCLKLIAVFILINASSDKLILFSIFTFIVSVLIQTGYKLYCKKHFKESKYLFFYEKSYYRELLSFSGWNLFGNFAVVTKWQGMNIILNLFFGPVVNSAYGITMQIQSAVGGFVQNFQLAVKPQIIQSFAQNNKERSNKLISLTSKYSYFLMYLIILPIIYNIDFILSKWLVVVPNLTSVFIKLSLIGIMIDSISEPLVNGIHASGKIKNYQIILSIILIVNLPLIYFLLKMGASAEIGFVVFIITNIIAFIYRLVVCSKLTNLNISLFITNILSKIGIITITSLVLIHLLSSNVQIKNEWINFFVSGILITLINILIIFIIGITREEKVELYKLIKAKLR